MTAREQLLHWLEIEKDRQLEFLQAFTRIDTCNPPGDTVEAADFFRRFLDEEKLPHRTEAPQATMPNLISSFAGKGKGRHLVLNGHLDVFPIGDRSVWKHDPLSGDIVDDRVYGRGTVDMKCGTTALLFVHAYLHRLRDELPGKVTRTVWMPLGSVFSTQSPSTWSAQLRTSQSAPHLPPVSSSDTTVSVTLPGNSSRRRWR